MEQVQIRPARADEAVAVGNVAVAAYEADGFLTLPGGAVDVRYRDWLADAAPRIAGDVVMVAEIGDRLVGSVTWCPFGSRSAELAVEPGQGEFRTLAVAPSARGRGVARALVAWCIGEAERTGLDEIWICSREEMAPAHALYLALGFERVPARDWSPVAGMTLRTFRRAVRVTSFGE